MNEQTKISTSKNSRPESIKNTMDSEDHDSYFTVKRLLYVYGEPLKIRPNGSKFRADIAIFGITGSASLTILNSSWEQLERGVVFSFTCMKFRSFKEKRYLTAPPFSTFSKLKDPGMPQIPEDYSNEVTSVVDNDIFDIRLLTSFSACRLCQKKVLYCDIRAYSFLCVYCHRNYPPITCQSADCTLHTSYH